MNKTTNISSAIRRKLLATASALALVAYGSSASAANAEDADHPLIWIELGGELNGMSSPQEAFVPPFVTSYAQNGIPSPAGLQAPPRYSLGLDGSIAFQPEGSDWIFSAAVRYGRSSRTQSSHQQTPNAKVPWHVSFPAFGINKYGSYYPSSHVKFADAAARQSESHFILDFQAGKDVGLGMFSGRGSSVISAGVRFAQFGSKSTAGLRAEPDVQYPTTPLESYAAKYPFKHAAMHFHDDAATFSNQRSFHGAGPSISWNASLPVAGNPSAGELALDWGANVAALFGRQKISGHHQTTVKTIYKQGWHYIADGNGTFGTTSVVHHTNQQRPLRSRTVVVPNLGGFAGISYRYSDAKLSLGYRADFFFNAIDGGIDTRKEENRGFFGPYASISVGLGD